MWEAGGQSSRRPDSVVANCVFCKEPLRRPAGKKWWIGGSHYDEGLCYDCILAGMRVIMAGVEYAQEHMQEIGELPPNVEHEPPEAAAAGSGTQTDRTGCLPLAQCSVGRQSTPPTPVLCQSKVCAGEHPYPLGRVPLHRRH